MQFFYEWILQFILLPSV